MHNRDNAFNINDSNRVRFRGALAAPCNPSFGNITGWDQIELMRFYEKLTSVQFPLEAPDHLMFNPFTLMSPDLQDQVPLSPTAVACAALAEEGSRTMVFLIEENSNGWPCLLYDQEFYSPDTLTIAYKAFFLAHKAFHPEAHVGARNGGIACPTCIRPHLIQAVEEGQLSRDEAQMIYEEYLWEEVVHVGTDVPLRLF